MKEDLERKELFKQFLEKKGFENVTTTDNFCRHDIEGYYKGDKYYFELKYRPHPHDNKYNDSIIQLDKYEYLLTLPVNHTYVVNIFNDGYLTVIPVNADHVLQEHFARKTTFWDRTKVKKVLVSYPNKKKYLYSYD